MHRGGASGDITANGSYGEKLTKETSRHRTAVKAAPASDRKNAVNGSQLRGNKYSKHLPSAISQYDIKRGNFERGGKWQKAGNWLQKKCVSRNYIYKWNDAHSEENAVMYFADKIAAAKLKLWAKERRYFCGIAAAKVQARH